MTGKIDLPDVYFGSVDAPPADWRAYEEEDPDDEELAETPESVVLMLGFDPLELDEDEDGVPSPENA